MERVGNVTHPDDIPIEKKPRKKAVRKKKYNNRKPPANYDIENDDPWIENKQVFKAVSFVRKMINEDNEPIELAIHIAAKYYKLSNYEVAKEMGRLGAFVREKKKKYRED